jgi:hypothetical protein
MIMGAEKYYNMTGEELFVEISKPETLNDCWFIERLRTAIQTHNPLVIVFLGEKIIEAYHRLRDFKTKQNG